ncbi:hypothetical protein ES708_09302 [subsurface metagenome]
MRSLFWELRLRPPRKWSNHTSMRTTAVTPNACAGKTEARDADESMAHLLDGWMDGCGEKKMDFELFFPLIT